MLWSVPEGLLRVVGSVKSRRLVALACVLYAPAAWADDIEAPVPVPIGSVEVSGLPDVTADGLPLPTLNLSLPAGAVKPLVKPARKTGSALTKIATAPTDRLTLGEGPVALDVKVPGGKDLTSGASLNLNLPDGAVKVQGTASVGKEVGQPSFWHKDAAEVEAKLAGPMGTALNVSAENKLSMTYRAPESVGASDQAAHLVQTESQAGHVSLTVPVQPFHVTTGFDSAADRTQQGVPGNTDSFNQSAVRTADHTAYVDVNWQPVDGLQLKGGTAAHVASISWQNAHASTYRSVNPNLTATMAPLSDTTVTAKVEHVVSPFDAAAFAAYANADKAAVASGFEPDHAWQVQTKVEQRMGPASLSATYTSARQGTVTEFADVRGVQAPATTPLVGRESVAVALKLPLSTIGLPSTVVSSEAKWQASRVVDPVTFETRTASGDAAETVSLKLAHTLPEKNLTLGLSGGFTGTRTSYQVREVSTTAPGGTVGAFVSYKPGAYEVDLNVDGLVGASTKADFYTGPRNPLNYSYSTVQDNSGPALKLSLKKPF